MPMGLAASWEMSRWVPTVPWSSASAPCTAWTAAFSISATIQGVANTGDSPEPAARAVLSGVTTVSARPFIPISTDMVDPSIPLMETSIYVSLLFCNSKMRPSIQWAGPKGFCPLRPFNKDTPPSHTV